MSRKNSINTERNSTGSDDNFKNTLKNYNKVCNTKSGRCSIKPPSEVCEVQPLFSTPYGDASVGGIL